MNCAIRLPVNAFWPAAVPGPPALVSASRAACRSSPRVAMPSLKKVRLYAASVTLSPHHWCMFSWYRVPRSITPPAKVIIVCISSSKLASGVPMMMPSEVNGNGPLNWLSKSVMSCC